MKIKLALVNISLITYLTGLLFSIGMGMNYGLVIVLGASLIIAVLYFFQLISSIRKNELWTFKNLTYSLAVLVIAEIFVHGFSISIDLQFLGNLPGFVSIHLFNGLILIIFFLAYSIKFTKNIEKNKQRTLLVTTFSIVALTSVLGLLSLWGIIPLTKWLSYYSWVSLLFFYLAFFLISLFSINKEYKSENLILVILCGFMIFYWFTRFNMPSLLPQGLFKSIIDFGFVPAVILPISIFYVNKFRFFTVFIFYFVLIDYFFIHLDNNFRYLVNVGLNGCVGYENATNYPVVTDPGLPINELFKEPTENEIREILTEWKEKDFTPKRVQVEYLELRPNGDSIKVVSHFFNGQKHYGQIRIPKNLNIRDAPILLGLMGGGTSIDVLETGDIYRLSSGKCRDILNNYISIMPAFRGNILRGEDFCFRSEGYTGDVWLGAAEDAVAFLEVVKGMYSKNDSSKVLASGISRGATVALIIGGLTNKLDYIISTSTHTKFLDYSVFQNERVGGSYQRVFFTPKTTPEGIRKRIIASSPYFFADQISSFELHQGAEDDKTSVQHAKLFEQRLNKIGKNDSTFKIYIYEGKGHGHDDSDIICESLNRFLNN